MSPAPLINTDSLNQWLDGQPRALAVPPPAHSRAAAKASYSRSHRWLAAKWLFAVRLWVIEAFTQWGWGGEDCRLVEGTRRPRGNDSRGIPRPPKKENSSFSSRRMTRLFNARRINHISCLGGGRKGHKETLSLVWGCINPPPRTCSFPF